MKQLLRYLPYLPWTVWFNFRYLPLRQAVRLPILLRKPRLLRCGGRIRIEEIGRASCRERVCLYV